MAASVPALSGVIPIAPTIFRADESVDLEGQRRTIEFLISAGVDAICILANYSEQFSLSDRERDEQLAVNMEAVNGRVPVVVTTSHYSTRIAIERSRAAAEAGAAAVMVMPPYHGATLRVDEGGLSQFFGELAAAIPIPIMIQDAPMSGTPLSAAFLARLVTEIPSIQYAKIESANAASKLRDLIALTEGRLAGPFDGEESVTLIPDLEAGATGTMPSSMIPDILGQVVRHWQAGKHEVATDLWEQWLPMIHYENRHCGLRATKILLKEGGIIHSEATRNPFGVVPSAIREGLIAHAKRRKPLILLGGTHFF